MRTHGALTEGSHTHSLTTPIGNRKGREEEGKRKGNAAAIWSLVDGCKSDFKVKFCTRRGV